MRHLLCTCTALLLSASAAFAQSENVVTSTLTYTGLQNAVLTAVLDIDLQDGWHTYWRTPGESGLAPTFDWTGSENMKDVAVLYPAPERDSQFDIHTFIYHDVALPLHVTATDPAKPVTLKGKISYMVCKDICVPETDEVSVTLDPTIKAHDQAVSDYIPAMANVPATDTAGAYSILSGVLAKDGLVVALKGAKESDKIETFIEQKNGYFLRPPVVKAEGDSLLLTFKGPADTDLNKELTGQKVTATIVIGEGDARQLLVKDFTF